MKPILTALAERRRRDHGAVDPCDDVPVMIQVESVVSRQGWPVGHARLKTVNDEATTVTRRWFLVARHWQIIFIRAEPPCWKGEVQIGPFVYGWQCFGEQA